MSDSVYHALVRVIVTVIDDYPLDGRAAADRTFPFIRDKEVVVLAKAVRYAVLVHPLPIHTNNMITQVASLVLRCARITNNMIAAVPSLVNRCACMVSVLVVSDDGCLDSFGKCDCGTVVTGLAGCCKYVASQPKFLQVLQVVGLFVPLLVGNCFFNAFPVKHVLGEEPNYFIAKLLEEDNGFPYSRAVERSRFVCILTRQPDVEEVEDNPEAKPVVVGLPAPRRLRSGVFPGLDLLHPVES